MLPLARCSMCGGAPSEGEHEAPVGVPTCVSGRALLARHEGDPGGVESVVPGRSGLAFGRGRGRAGEGEVVWDLHVQGLYYGCLLVLCSGSVVMMIVARQS